jgi:hypothetical protein
LVLLVHILELTQNQVFVDLVELSGVQEVVWLHEVAHSQECGRMVEMEDQAFRQCYILLRQVLAHTKNFKVTNFYIVLGVLVREHVSIELILDVFQRPALLAQGLHYLALYCKHR